MKRSLPEITPDELAALDAASHKAEVELRAMVVTCEAMSRKLDATFAEMQRLRDQAKA